MATDQGGNVDFCLPISAYLVCSKACKVRKNDSIEATKPFWGKPDITSAATMMQALADTAIKCKKKRLNQL